jgi:O-succinylbenzoic acid--CoA ligase
VSDSPSANESEFGESEFGESASRLAAIATPHGVLSFGQLESAAGRGEQHLRECGIGAGDAVGVALGPGVEALVLIRALMRLGACACLIDPRWPENEIGRCLSTAGCRCVIDRFALDAEGAHPEPAEIDPNARATVVFTSGSTGAPRPAAHSVDNHVQSALAGNANIPLQPGDRWLLSLPIHHVAGIAIVFRCAAAGAAVAVPDPDMPLARAIEVLGPTHLSLVPTQLRRLLDEDGAASALARVKAVLMGGAPMPGDLVARAFGLGIPIHTSYGLTETSSQITATRPGDNLDALMTSGAPLTPGTVSISGEGEILVRGGSLFLGYLEGGELRRPLTAGGWFATGDLGVFDAKGRLIVTGRRDNMFVSGGENVQPEEVERRLCELPGVEQAIVVPVADDEYGEVGAAYIEMAEGVPLDAASLAAQLREHLPAYKIPKRFHPWPAGLPESVAKTSRRITAENLAKM